MNSQPLLGDPPLRGPCRALRTFHANGDSFSRCAAAASVSGRPLSDSDAHGCTLHAAAFIKAPSLRRDASPSPSLDLASFPSPPLLPRLPALVSGITDSAAVYIHVNVPKTTSEDAVTAFEDNRQFQFSGLALNLVGLLSEPGSAPSH